MFNKAYDFRMLVGYPGACWSLGLCGLDNPVIRNAVSNPEKVPVIPYQPQAHQGSKACSMEMLSDKKMAPPLPPCPS